MDHLTRTTRPTIKLGLGPRRKDSTGPQREAVRQRASFNPLQFYDRTPFKNERLKKIIFQ